MAVASTTHFGIRDVHWRCSASLWPRGRRRAGRFWTRPAAAAAAAAAGAAETGAEPRVGDPRSRCGSAMAADAGPLRRGGALGGAGSVVELAAPAPDAAATSARFGRFASTPPPSECVSLCAVRRRALCRRRRRRRLPVESLECVAAAWPARSVAADADAAFAILKRASPTAECIETPCAAAAAERAPPLAAASKRQELPLDLCRSGHRRCRLGFASICAQETDTDSSSAILDLVGAPM